MAARLRAGAVAGDLTAAAAEIILGAGYTIYDDLAHGFGGGYLPPVISRADLESGRTAAPPARRPPAGDLTSAPPAQLPPAGDLTSAAPAQLPPAGNFTFAAGMTVVLQPNVITPDERAGVQTGELVLVTESGWEPLHRYPRGLGRIGG
jgi:Xaa-Pro aminopeptidase